MCSFALWFRPQVTEILVYHCTTLHACDLHHVGPLASRGMLSYRFETLNISRTLFGLLAFLHSSVFAAEQAQTHIQKHLSNKINDSFFSQLKKITTQKKRSQAFDSNFEGHLGFEQHATTENRWLGRATSVKHDLRKGALPATNG